MEQGAVGKRVGGRVSRSTTTTTSSSLRSSSSTLSKVPTTSLLPQQSPPSTTTMKQEQSPEDEGDDLEDSSVSGRGGNDSSINNGPGMYTFEMLDDHITKGKHGKKLYKCDVCAAEYRHSFSLKRHFIRTHVNYQYLCETDIVNCGLDVEKSASLRSWKDTQAVDKNDSDEDDDDGNPNHLPGLYACHSCIVFYSTLKGLKVHVDAFHRNIDSGTIEPVRIPCEACNMTFIQRHNLEKHIQQVHSNLPRPPSSLTGSIGGGSRCKHDSGTSQRSQSGLNVNTSTTSSTAGGKKASLVKKVPQQSPPAGKGQTVQSETRKSPRNTSTTTTRQSSKQLQSSFPSELNQRIYPCDECNDVAYRSETALLHHKKTSHHKKVVVVSRGQRSRNTVPEYASSVASDSSTKGGGKGHYFDTNDPQDVEFFSSVAQRIAENLQYHVDGRISDLKSGQSSSKRRNSQSLLRSPTATATTSGQQQGKGGTMDKDTYLEMECKLRMNQINNQPTVRVPLDDNLCLQIKNYGHHYICSTCGSREPDVKSFYAHALNNHPNVLSNYILVEASNTIPGRLLTWRYNDPNGLLKRSSTSSSSSSFVDPSDSGMVPLTAPSVKCTKCGHSFVTIDLLHGHMFDCARSSVTSSSSSSTHFNPSSCSTNYGPNYRKRQPPSRSSSPENDEASASGYTTRSGRKRSSPGTSVTSSSTTQPTASSSKSGSKSVNKGSQQQQSDVVDNQNDFNGSNKDVNNDGNKKSSKKSNKCERCNKLFTSNDLISFRKHRQSCLRLKIKLPSIAGGHSFLTTSSGDNAKRKRLSLDEEDDEEESIEEELMDIEEPIDTSDPDFVLPKVKVKASPLKRKTLIVSKISEQKEAEDAKNDDAIAKDEKTEKDGTDDAKETSSSPAKDVSQSDWKKEDQPYVFKGTPTQHHSCPYCHRGFTYLANYTKHMKDLCPIQQQLKDAANNQQNQKVQQQQTSSSSGLNVSTAINTSLGNISAVSGLSTSTLLINSTTTINNDSTNKSNNNINENNISTAIIKDGHRSSRRSINSNSNQQQQFKSFSCQVCHKIYFSHLDLMKHILSHKLTINKSSQEEEENEGQQQLVNYKNDLLNNLANGGLNPVVNNKEAAQINSDQQVDGTSRPQGQQSLVTEQEASAALAAGIILLDDSNIVNTRTTKLRNSNEMVIIEDIEDDETYQTSECIKIGNKKWPSTATTTSASSSATATSILI